MRVEGEAGPEGEKKKVDAATEKKSMFDTLKKVASLHPAPLLLYSRYKS